MLARIFWCVFGALALWVALLFLTSEQTPQGTTAITYGFLYADSLLGLFVLVSSLFACVFPLVFVRALHARPLRQNETALVKVSRDSERWQATTVGYLENLKSQLWEIEARARYLHTSELQVRRLYEEAPGALALWLAERGLCMLRHQCSKESAAEKSLRQAIERIYAGDIDFEVRNLREEICQLQVKRTKTDSEGIRSDYDKSIRFYQRQIDELEQWSKKVSAASSLGVNESPNESAWRNFVDEIRRTAAVPLAQSISRVEAAMEAVAAKQFYENMATERWRRGTLTDDELSFIRQRINEEFLGNTTSIYA